MIIQTVTPKTWTNPEGKEVAYAELAIDGKTYSCWQKITLKAGDVIEGAVTEKGQHRQIRVTSIGGTAVESKGGGKGGGRPGDPKSFAASYAKDVLVACINNGIVHTSKEFDGTLEHYFAWFLAKMGG